MNQPEPPMASTDRIIRLSIRSVRYIGDKRYTMDLDQQSLDAWTNEEIATVEKTMDERGLTWDQECQSRYQRHLEIEKARGETR